MLYVVGRSRADHCVAHKFLSNCEKFVRLALQVAWGCMQPAAPRMISKAQRLRNFAGSHVS